MTRPVDGDDAETLSIVVPCHNAGALLLETLRSVVEQGLAPASFTVVVVDDRSDQPETRRILEHLAQDGGGNITVVSNPGLRGPAAARNFGVRASRSRWIAFLDADDLLAPHSVASRLAVARRYPAARWIGGDFLLFDSQGSEDAPFLRSRRGPQRYLAPAFETGSVQVLPRPARPFLDTLLTHTDTVLIRRDLFEQAGGFCEELRTAEDYHLWVRLAVVEDFYFLPTVVAKYRRHESSITHGRATGAMRMRALELLRNDPSLRECLDAVDAKMFDSFLEDVRFHRRRHEFRQAMRCAVRAIKLRPTSHRAWRDLAASAAGRP
jgi:glycosyltransferase involved in cell wall biosynthesis